MSGYKILRLQGLTYPGAEDIAYKSNPKLSESPYRIQKEAILSQKIVYSEGFSNAMRALGNDAYEILFDCERLQKTWAKERNFQFRIF